MAPPQSALVPTDFLRYRCLPHRHIAALAATPPMPPRSSPLLLVRATKRRPRCLQPRVQRQTGVIGLVCKCGRQRAARGGELERMRPLYDYSYRPPGLIYPRPCHIHPHWIRGSVVHPRVHHARHAAPPGNFDVAMRCPSSVGRKLDPVLHTSAHAPQPPGRERCARPGASRPF